MKLPAPQNQSDETFFEYIKDPGWGITAIPGSRKGPGYAFSVGLYYTFQHPELVVSGLPAEMAEDIINTAGELIAEGKRFEHHSRSDEILESFFCGFATVDVRNYKKYLEYANWFYGDLAEPFPCLQILWPDKKGRLPGDEGVDKKLLRHQPLLTVLEE